MRRPASLAFLCGLVPILLAFCAHRADAQPVKNRISVMVDSSGSMLLTPEIVTFSKTCPLAGSWNPCAGNGTNPTFAQEACNPCVADTVTFRPACANSWSATCLSDYNQCLANVTGQTTCSPTMTYSDGISTRGDGSADLTGCDLNGDGLANDSRMYQAKEALNNVVATFGEVEFSLWRYAQVTGGQTCTTDASCPDTPGGASVLTCENHDASAATANVCALDADILDNATAAGVEGQCARFTYTGSASTFSCDNCDAAVSYDRASCQMFDLDRVKSTGVSPLNGTSTVQCFPSANPQHRFMRYHGGINNAGACDPTGGQRLVNFPATGFDDNYPQIASWIDHNQNPFTSTDELRPQGGTPIAASLRDMRTSVLASLTADNKTPCRKYQVIFLTDGGESCESVAAAQTAAATFQNMSFINPNGVSVTGYNVPVYVIGFAICPPGSPNCQTRQDLNSIASAGGTGSAILVNNQLELQVALAQIVAASVVTERCNNLDDDCDTRIDEDFPGKGASCSAGAGQCLANGTVVCTADQLGLACNATAGSPSPEVCNNLDDNCDGLIDNGISCGGCVPVCSNAAGCDICNNIDEDCDTRIDENFTPTSCGIATGACNPGTTACVAGTLSCAGSTGPVSETCNNLDDDCDAIVDGMTQPCYPAPTGCSVATGVCQGICRLGNQTCTAGTFGTCSGAVTPGTEIACNGLDDDCDGLTDEVSGTEQCNGVDDDCDSRVDEGVAVTDPDIGDPCGTAPFVGECRQGALACVAGAQVCQGEIDPTTEVCDNRDNDCDGTVDDSVPGFGGACGSSVGRCDPGTLQCVAGAPACVGQIGPFAEVCNSQDDNCNGATDETDPSLGNTCNTLPGGGTVATDTGECRFGVLACQAGGLACIGAAGPVAERCNALDDDCDAATDEAFPTLGQTCDNGALGVCRQTGVVVCAPGGAGVTCTAPPGSPGTESCNGLDDDCDGMVDEGPPPPVGNECAPATGVCAPGLWQCNAGVLECGQPSSGSPEVCDTADNDCDALVDESPVGTPLPGEEEDCVEPGFEPFGDTGECEFGSTECVNGDLDCIGYQGPSTEICDGLDNDCDGNADDFATCPDPTNACAAGTCVVPCGAGEFPCPGGFTCEQLDDVPVPGNYCVPDPCNGVTCGPTEVCDPATRTCRDLCDGVTCATGEECRLGVCIDCFDVPSLCMAGELCVEDGSGVGQCEDNLCDPNPCMANEVCTNGTCSASCGAGCPTGEVCVGGACVPDLCDGVTCTGNQVCDPATGDCVNGECSGVQCRVGEVCVEITGECIADPCISTDCPMGQECSVDPGGRPVCAEPETPPVVRVTAAGGGCSTGGDPTGGAALLVLALGAGLAPTTADGAGWRCVVSRALVYALAALLAVVTACDVNPYTLGGGTRDADVDASSDGGGDDGGTGDDGGGEIDAGIDGTTCVPRAEVCNNADDDCDTVIDNGFNLQQDPNNCGVCGRQCTYPHAFGTCETGTCVPGACQPGWNDSDPLVEGCEYFCIPTNGSVEVCDNRDNDCDTELDEDFALDDDENNCGRCGNVCNLLHASAVCTTGVCEVAMCDPGFIDVDPAVAGCEYQCTPSNGGVESCDGVDNDCDGTVDDGNPGGGASCGTDLGVCSAGTTSCSFGVLFCVGNTTGAPEACNNLDDDCDGTVDDGYDKQNDPLHCGGCSPCMVPNATPGCSVGACTIASCNFGFFNNDGAVGNGCEYACVNTGTERCDSVDNNCNGTVDEGFNLTTDPANCGLCGRTCSFANAAAGCSASTCVMGTCNPNFFNLNGSAADGCEYGCVLTNGGVETCDGIDNDCNGVIDNGNPGGGVTCGTNTGECTAGTTSCAVGAIDCVGDVGAASESCNNLDDDCNGVVDNGFNKLTDPRYCNNCAGCTLAHAVPGCSGGACTVAGCLAGWVNLDGVAANGCEYACTASGQEVCDGVDNDCDGLVDQADPSILVPANFCKTAGECAGTTPSCTGATGWDCIYTDPDVERQPNGDPVLEESRCDGRDNDCDGGADEVYPLKNTACAEDGTFATTRRLGACRGSGTLVCNAAMTGLRCNVTTAGAAAVNETCDNVDNDCDGHTDEPYDSGGFLGVRDVTIGPLTINGQSIVMYRYEATRPDATAAAPGIVSTRACSVANRMPWASANFTAVQAACTAAGKRLCRVTRNAGGQVLTDEWGRFCEGSANRTYPYGSSYVANNCNGSDYDPVAGGVNEDQAIATGSLGACLSQDSSNDQSGNLKEWVSDPRTVSGQTVHTLRGGSFDNYAPGMTCDFDLTVVPLTYSFANAGFRCCSLACGAGEIECSGACVNPSISATNCGGCGQTCGGGQACSNGYCCPTGSRACGDVCVPNATPCP